MPQVTFTVYTKPQSQGSIRSFKHRVTGAIVSISTNKKLKGFRDLVGRVAATHLTDERLPRPMAASGVPVELYLTFCFLKPRTAPRSRRYPTLPPDIDKLERATLDALTGVVYADDSQVVRVTKEKVYGPVESVHVFARTMKESSLF